MRKLIIVALLLVPALSWASSKDSLIKEIAASISSADLKMHLTVLASDEFEGRETGERGQKLAAEYISDYFRKIGLKATVEGNYYQKVPLKKKMNGSGTIKVNDKSFEHLRDFYSFRRSVKMEIKTEEVVFLGFGIGGKNYSDYTDGIDVKDKLVMILEGEPLDKRGRTLVNGEKGNSGWNVFAKADHARRNGAKGVLVVKENFEFSLLRIKKYMQRPQLSLEADDNEDGVPVIFISKRMADEILGEKRKGVDKIWKKLSKKGKPNSFTTPTNLDLKISSIIETVESENVLGYIEGTDLKDEILVLTAHYDHIGIDGDEINNGADDDGSGTVTIMELAQAFQKAKEAGFGPRRSILFMTVSGEEKGLLGSKYYVEHPLFPLENTIANLNIDMIGRIDENHTDGNYVYLIGSDRLSSALHVVSEEANEKYTGLELDYTFNDPADVNKFYYRSDHYNFAKNGIPVIFYFNGVHEDYHKPTDTVEKIDFQKMEKIAHLVFYTAWELANRDERPLVDKPVEE